MCVCIDACIESNLAVATADRPTDRAASEFASQPKFCRQRRDVCARGAQKPEEEEEEEEEDGKPSGQEVWRTVWRERRLRNRRASHRRKFPPRNANYAKVCAPAGIAKMGASSSSFCKLRFSAINSGRASPRRTDGRADVASGN